MSTSRSEGCTLTGALSVTTGVKDAVTIIHGPAGCAHHNVSLFFSLLHEQDIGAIPAIRCTDLRESEVIFGGEEVLEALVQRTAREGWKSVFVLSTCVVDTIGDDVAAVCSREYGVPVCYIPTSGFLGGVFQTGYENALLALSSFACRASPGGTITLIGEKNLEYEVEENFCEISRLLSSLGTGIGLRYVRNIATDRLAELGCSSLNILRDRSIGTVGEKFQEMFGTPYIEALPEGFSQTCDFLEKAGELLGRNPKRAVDAEISLQKHIIARFRDLAGQHVCFWSIPGIAGDSPAMEEIVQVFDLTCDEDGICLEVPDPFPVGTAGMSRLLHRWRRTVRAVK
ncbi:MAG TPA: nitrogenase component 1 [Methanoregulaceae archaeon]|nr:nitrogenase component 1 [Methanoregulaceae archaeon]MDD5047434.1 nitrogenase component 1 [Methanoregulaceae archaeon]MDD5684144.1 nitrogenase component 1 [Methanoregulaceae archaeon]HPJ73964.1 nitrogenase component 1 [Methanoregulaceae archaeon]HPQ75606.1 nitrogenase component 1 [Methanoregulaceae archaeon]